MISYYPTNFFALNDCKLIPTFFSSSSFFAPILIVVSSPVNSSSGFLIGLILVIPPLVEFSPDDAIERPGSIPLSILSLRTSFCFDLIFASVIFELPVSWVVVGVASIPPFAYSEPVVSSVTPSEITNLASKMPQFELLPVLQFTLACEQDSIPRCSGFLRRALGLLMP